MMYVNMSKCPINVKCLSVNCNPTFGLPCIYIYNSRLLCAAQSQYFGSKLPTYRNCTTPIGLELFCLIGEYRIQTYLSSDFSLYNRLYHVS